MTDSRAGRYAWPQRGVDLATWAGNAGRRDPCHFKPSSTPVGGSTRDLL